MSTPWETVRRSDGMRYHAQCELGARVRSKRGYGLVHGTIVERASPQTRKMYEWLVRWDDGTEEWCRDGELRTPDENDKGPPP